MTTTPTAAARVSGTIKALDRPSPENATWTICPETLIAIRDAAGDQCDELDLEHVEAIALAVEARILAAIQPDPEPATCRKCGGLMEPGVAIAQTFTSGLPDDLGGDECTMSAGGPGVVVDCCKCSDCGWSVTATDPEPPCAHWRGSGDERHLAPIL